ncbi:MAG: RHS repeat-associated core domain-containing protein [Gemmatimonadetes bacterium]|nr:RHS repeat-associated core domain-containing protein [Gemmatimonadota bacterium]
MMPSGAGCGSRWPPRTSTTYTRAPRSSSTSTPREPCCGNTPGIQGAWTSSWPCGPRPRSVIPWRRSLTRSTAPCAPGPAGRTGAKVKEYAEAPWGDAVADTGVVVRYRFAGREYDSESGLYYMRARYYDPALGRWISEDPIGVEGGHNLFGYSGNDPVNVVDPWGLDPLCGEGWVQIVTRGVDENGVPT